MKIHYPIFLFIVLSTSIKTYSQSAVGVRAGLTSSNWVAKSSGLTNTSDRLTAITIGVPFELQITDLFAIQPELNFITRGAINRLDLSFFGIPVKTEQISKINYLEVPILGKLSFRSGTAKLELLFGPSLAYGLDGSYKFTETLNGQTQTDKQSLNFKNDSISRTDFSLNFGLGISLPTGMNRVFIDFRYQLGLTNIAAPANVGTTNKLDVKDNTLQFCLGMFFPLMTNKKGVVPMIPKK